MALASDLMGLGTGPLLAARTAQGGIGPLTITAAGSVTSGATRLGNGQFTVSCSNADGTMALQLPRIGGDTGCLLADVFTINNATATTSLQIVSGSIGGSVLISGRGTNSSTIAILSHSTMTLIPISQFQWIAVGGAGS
jgi:hypothetical protein